MKRAKRLIVNILSVPLTLVALPLSLIPLMVIRALNPIVSFLAFRIIGYRKQVVFDNFRKAFPEMNQSERERLAKGYYKHLASLILDTIGFISLRKSTVKKLGSFKKDDIRTIDQYYSQQKSIILAMSHFGSWEVLGAVFNQRFPGYSVAGYRPLTNKVVDAVIYYSRKRLNNLLVPTKKLARKTLEMVNAKQPFALMLISDQWPPPANATWVDFMGIKTPFYNGLEKLSRKFDLPVVFISTRKNENGTYSIFTNEITNEPKSLPQGEITRRYAGLLENEIKNQPEYWLWSHRRWKAAPEKT